MPIISSASGASSQAWGQFKQSAAPIYIEDVFSTYLYTGNGGTQTITNGIDLAGKGGLVWQKMRSSGGSSHILFDTSRGFGNYLLTNWTGAQGTNSTWTTGSFNSNGFTDVADAGDFSINASGYTYASWTFRKQPKFFDIVTYTGNGSTSWRYINHNLQATPAFIIVKNLSRASDWLVYSPIAAGSGYDMILNSTAPSQASNESQGRVYATSSTQFQVICTNASGTSVTGTNVNQSGDSYVAYLFASNAGGFGLDGTQNVISCGSFTTNASGDATVTLGWEPQYLLIKNTSSSENWKVVDTMRGFVDGGRGFDDNVIYPNTSGAEVASSRIANPLATGFFVYEQFANNNYIYMAIRRGPMKVPTSGTTVFNPVTYSGGTTNRLINYGFPVDAWIDVSRSGGTPLAGFEWPLFTRLLSNGNAYKTGYAEAWGGGWGASYLTLDNNSGVYLTTNPGYLNASGTNYTSYGFVRAPNFFDEVYYSGTGAARTVQHNLNAVPELILVRCYNTNQAWAVYYGDNTRYMVFNTNAARAVASTYWNNTSPTASVFTVGSSAVVNGSGNTYSAYLFSSCPGVSKVGTYTGTGATLNVDCGFTGGARFVMIKRADNTGNWWFWDTARGMVAGTDPRSAFNLISPTAETNTNWVYTATGGFQIVTTDSSVNANGGTYIYLAIA